jgi:hypothetical protein
MTANTIAQLIEIRQAKIAAAKRSIEDLEKEIGALTEAQDAMAGRPGANAKPLINKRSDNTPPRRGRGLSAASVKVLDLVAATGKAGADLDEVEKSCKEAKIKITRAALRMQLKTHVKRGRLTLAAGERYVSPNATPEPTEAPAVAEPLA